MKAISKGAGMESQRKAEDGTEILIHLYTNNEIPLPTLSITYQEPTAGDVWSLWYPNVTIATTNPETS